MLSECVIALIAQVVLCSNVYLVAVFFVHRDQFTPKTLLQGNLVVCNLLSSYYLSCSSFDEAFFSTENPRKEQSSGWNMTLCSLSTSSWALTVCLWYKYSQHCKNSDTLKFSFGAVYGIIGALWLYYVVLVATHVLRIVGWTFDSHDLSGILGPGLVLYIVVPFVIPWMIQAWLFIDLSPSLTKSTMQSFIIKAKEFDFKEIKTEKDKLEKEDGEVVEQTVSHLPARLRPSGAGTLANISTIFFSGSIAIFVMSIVLLYFSASTSSSLSMMFVGVVCVAWINCSTGPFLLVQGEEELRHSRATVDTIIKMVCTAVRDYMQLCFNRNKVLVVKDENVVQKEDEPIV